MRRAATVALCGLQIILLGSCAAPLTAVRVRYLWGASALAPSAALLMLDLLQTMPLKQTTDGSYVLQISTSKLLSATTHSGPVGSLDSCSALQIPKVGLFRHCTSDPCVQCLLSLLNCTKHSKISSGVSQKSCKPATISS